MGCQQGWGEYVDEDNKLALHRCEGAGGVQWQVRRGVDKAAD